MLVLFDLSKNYIHAFKTYGALHNHLESLESVEKAKGKDTWIFAQHPWQRMLSYYRYVRDRNVCAQSAETFEQGLEEALKQAVAGKLILAKGEEVENFDILEMINGDVKRPIFIPVTPDVDVGALQVKWCQNYCKLHGYPLFEISSPDDFKEAGGGHDHVAE